MREKAFSGPHAHAEPFWATRQHSTTRGEALFGRGAWPQDFPSQPSQRGRTAICQGCLASSPGAGMREIAFFGAHPGDPVTMSHFGPRDSIRRRVGRPCLEGGPGPRIFRASPARGAGRPFTRAVWPPHRGQGGPLSKSARLPGQSGRLTGGSKGSG